MITAKQEQRDRVERECETRKMVTGTGDEADGTACLMSAVNFGLTGRLTDGPHPCVSEVVRHVVIGLHDYLPDALRSGIAWRSLGPLMLGTQGDGHDQARVQLVRDWVQESVLRDPAVPSSLEPVSSGTRAKMYAQADAADRLGAYSAAAYAAYSAAAGGADAAAADRLAARHAFAACEAACQAAAHAANLVYGTAGWTTGHATAHAALTAAREEFWARADPAALVRSLCEIGR
jgi:hypothetical protein